MASSELYLQYFKSKIYLKYDTLTQFPHIHLQLGEVIFLKRNNDKREEIILSESILNISVVV